MAASVAVARGECGYYDGDCDDIFRGEVERSTVPVSAVPMTHIHTPRDVLLDYMFPAHAHVTSIFCVERREPCNTVFATRS